MTCSTPMMGDPGLMISSADRRAVTANPGVMLTIVKMTGPTASMSAWHETTLLGALGGW